MPLRIPPIHALLALDSFARLGSVTLAAEELGVTRSAVSHRLALLEELLGFRVLERAGKRVALTARGSRYAVDVGKALVGLAGAYAEGEAPPIEGVLRVSSTAGFASMWLCNHLASFSAEHPNLRVDVVTRPEVDATPPGDIDVSVVFGGGHWPGHEVRHLYDVEFLPVCSPALLNAKGGLNAPADVLHYPLLHLRHMDDWRDWLKLNGLQLSRGTAGITFSDMMLVQTAAIAAQGIMMGDEVTCAGALAAGLLVSPFPTTIKSTDGYYLLSDRRKRPKPSVAAFTRWLDALITRVGAELKNGRFKRH